MLGKDVTALKENYGLSRDGKKRGSKTLDRDEDVRSPNNLPQRGRDGEDDYFTEEDVKNGEGDKNKTWSMWGSYEKMS